MSVIDVVIVVIVKDGGGCNDLRNRGDSPPAGGSVCFARTLSSTWCPRVVLTVVAFVRVWRPVQ